MHGDHREPIYWFFMFGTLLILCNGEDMVSLKKLARADAEPVPPACLRPQLDAMFREAWRSEHPAVGLEMRVRATSSAPAAPVAPSAPAASPTTAATDSS
ncbi:hypothetical protein ACP70R_028767 [Stipagrostis hirtigluma subsp. patula]